LEGCSPHFWFPDRKKYDETLPTISNQSTQKRGKTRNKMEGPMFKKTNEAPKRGPKRGESQGEHQVPQPLLVPRNMSNKERGGLLGRMFS
jgi:hypothetical protein